MSDSPSFPPTARAIATAPLTPARRALRSIPIVRSLFRTPAGCVADISGLPLAAGTGPGKSRVTLKEVETDHDLERRLHIAEVVPGKIVGDALLATTVDDVVVGDMQGLHGVAEPTRHWMFRRCRFRREIRLAGMAVMLSAAAGHNYYHWLFESLPRLNLLRLAGCNFDEVNHCLLNEIQHPFHAQTLDLLGVPAHKRRRCSKWKTLVCDRLILPSLPGPPMSFRPWVLSFLRQSFLPLAETAAGKTRLYISRGATRRRLINESEIQSLLAGAGFKSVRLEDHTFAQQVGMFAAAEVVVALHGAGLANLVFANPGTKVIEFVAPTFINHCYEKLARAMQLTYVEVVGQLPEPPRKRADEDDVLVPLPMAQQALAQCGL